MTPAPIPPTMKMPSDRKPNVWFGGVAQVMVGRACDLKCTHCTQLSNMRGKAPFMTPGEFEAAVASLEANKPGGYFGVVGVFGGNPCLSPHFPHYCAIMRAHVPKERRGLWSNNLHGHGHLCAHTFNPAVSNLNVHMSDAAYREIERDWPAAIEARTSHVKNGLEVDSIHGPPFVAMKDVIEDEAERWKLIGACDINQNWSFLIGVVPGKGLRLFFCEIAYSQAVGHADNPDYDGTGAPMPDLGIEVTPGCWKLPREAFDAQVRLHCHACGIPLRAQGQGAVTGDVEQFSETHRWLMKPKDVHKRTDLVSLGQYEGPSRRFATDYLPNTTATR